MGETHIEYTETFTARNAHLIETKRSPLIDSNNIHSQKRTIDYQLWNAHWLLQRSQPETHIWLNLNIHLGNVHWLLRCMSGIGDNFFRAERDKELSQILVTSESNIQLHKYNLRWNQIFINY